MCRRTKLSYTASNSPVLLTRTAKRCTMPYGVKQTADFKYNHKKEGELKRQGTIMIATT
jgi:hypothetical protein